MATKNKLMGLLAFLAAGPVFSQVVAGPDVFQITQNGQVYDVPRGKAPQLVACGSMFGNLAPGHQAIYRKEVTWAGDGKQILLKPCNSGQAKFAKLPEGLVSYSAFEVTDEGQLVLWGAEIANVKEKQAPMKPPSEWARGLLVDPETGKVAREFGSVHLDGTTSIYDILELSEAITCRVEGQIILAGVFSGHLFLFDPLSGKTDEIIVVEESQLPAKGSERVNHGPCITQLVPMPGGELLIGARFWSPAKADVPGEWMDVFRTLNLTSRELSAPTAAFKGMEAFSGLIWVDWNLQPRLLKHLPELVEKTREAAEETHR